VWKDTALLLTTDHGFLLGEHDFWAKNRMNLYEEIVHIPMFAHDPRRPRGGERVGELTQVIDIAPSILDLFGVPVPPEMEGHNILPVQGPVPKREGAIFGYFGGAVNVTDGRYTYHRFPADLRHQEVYQYTVMPTHIYSLFTAEELAQASLSEAFPFTKGSKLLRVPVIARSPMYNNYGPGAFIENDTRLYDLTSDPGQDKPLRDPAQEQRMLALMARLMAEDHAPPEAFRRLEIAEPAKAA
jgi:arylsulfatase A-like enzyme